VSDGRRLFNKMPPAGAPSLNAGLMGKSRDAPVVALPEPVNVDLAGETGDAGTNAGGSELEDRRRPKEAVLTPSKLVI